MHPFERLLHTGRKRVVGLMSGTSADAIDAALVEIEGSGAAMRLHLVAFHQRPYSPAMRARIFGLFDGPTRAVCQGSFLLGEELAAAALEVVRLGGLSLADLDLVGSHGQTLWHQPPSTRSGTASTLQIGEPAVIAARTGAVTVADFRVADMAVGGEGAPLVPYADWVLYHQPGRRRALQNIGGIANLALLGDRLEDVIAFDNGPGNMMLDALAPAASGGADSFDRDGRHSARGRIQPDLLAELLDDDFLRQSPPKSTGRERYGAPHTFAWAAAHADRAPEDLLATAVAFTAESIADSYRRFLLPHGGIDEALISGGGARNPTLMTALARALHPIPVRVFNEQGVPAAAKEAVAFALLAVAAIDGVPANILGATGAERPAVLGKICLPPGETQCRKFPG